MTSIGAARQRLFIAAGAAWLSLASLARAQQSSDRTAIAPLPASAPRTADELQARIDQAAPHTTIICDLNRELVVSKPIRVKQAITIQGLAARLPDGLSNSPLMVVEAEGVTITDFALRGNADTVDQSERASLLVFNAGNLRVGSGRFDNVAKNGLTIEPRKESPRDVVGGLVRDLVGDGVVRDVVSISGGDGTAAVRNIVVENIRGYRSKLRGAVEVSDGTSDITVRNIYAEDSAYAVDIQDHNGPKQINVNVLIDNVTAIRCRHAVRFNVHDFGHRDISLQNITAIDNEQPLHIRHIDRLTATNVRIFGSGEKWNPVSVSDCDGAILRGFWLERVPKAEHLITIEQSNHVLVDGVISRDEHPSLKSPIAYDSESDGTRIEIRNVLIAGSAASAPVFNGETGADTSE